MNAVMIGITEAHEGKLGLFLHIHRVIKGKSVGHC
jgi:hypothetical protein